MKTKKNLTHWLSVIVIGIALGLALQFVRAWAEPTVAPPGGNVGAPINTSATAQTKAGNLNLNGGMLIGASTTGGNKGAGTINADQVCIRGVCQTTWPSGGSSGGGGGTPAPHVPVLIGGCSYYASMCSNGIDMCSSWGGAYCSSCGACTCNAGSLSCNLLNPDQPANVQVTECQCWQ